MRLRLRDESSSVCHNFVLDLIGGFPPQELLQSDLNSERISYQVKPWQLLISIQRSALYSLMVITLNWALAMIRKNNIHKFPIYSFTEDQWNKIAGYTYLFEI